MSNCISQRISWLALEQYRLDDLPSEQRQRIAQHLDQCPACAGDLQKIGDDVRPLKPLTLEDRKKAFPPLRFSIPAIAGTAIIAAVLLTVLFDRVPQQAGSAKIPPHHIEFKGGELAMMVARERNGWVEENPSQFAEGDNFTVFLTHSSPEPIHWDVIIEQGGETYFPYTDRPPLAAGNLVPLPGAFRLTGVQPITICVVVGTEPLSRAALKRVAKSALPPATVCKQMKSHHRDR